MIGESIGNFQITAELGRGGMGDVFLGEHREIHTKVAVKLLHANISSDATQIERFFNEAKAVGMIKHAGTVKIFDCGITSTARAYLIMEFLEGETLSSRIERQTQLTIGEVSDIGRQASSVLAATHAEGIVHRDLKPDNIYLVRDAEMARGERVKILDFGIAKLANTNLTGSASSMGTPAYMAPEQWSSSGKVDWRADAYSLGCVAFEMLTGRPPFQASSIAEACAAHLGDLPPTVRSLRPDVPAELDLLVARMLAKKPEDRPASMAEIQHGFSIHADSPSSSLYAVGPPPATAARNAITMPTGEAVPISLTAGAAIGAPIGTTGPAGPIGTTGAPTEPRKRRAPVAVAVAVLLVGGGSLAAVLATRHHEPRATKPAHPAPIAAIDAASPPLEAAVAAPSGPAMANPFVEIAPPAHAVVLGLASDTAPDDERGYRPARKVLAPTEAYAIQQHEVTWSELEPFLAARGEHLDLPPWAQDPARRAHLPATGVSWQLAQDYCVSITGELPTDEEWEYAARGPALRPNPWGDARLDHGLTHALAGDKGEPVEVMTSEQDRTPEGGPRLFDLAGNVQEWTEGLWRADKAGADESWVEDGDTTFRALRGLPLRGDPKTKVQAAAAAYREPACATGACNGKDVPPLDVVGFRCVRDARSAGHTAQHPVAAPKLDAGVAGSAPPADAAVAHVPLDAAVKPPPPIALPAQPPQAAVDRITSELKSKIRACASSVAHVRGTRVVTVQIAPNGHVSYRVDIPAARSCVDAAMAGVTAPASREGASGSFTLSFGRGSRFGGRSTGPAPGPFDEP